MITKDQNNRECDIEVIGTDHEDFEIDGTYTDTGEPLSADSLDFFESGECDWKVSQWIYESIAENAACRAEDAWERSQDR